MVIIRRIAKKDHQSCVQLYTKSFFQDESIFTRLGYDEDQVSKWATADKEDSFKYGLSWLAEDEANGIIGVRFSKPFTCNEPGEASDPIAVSAHNMCKRFIDAHPEILEPQSKILHLSGSAVSKKYRRQGVASMLTQVCLSHAIELGYEWAFVLATSDAVVRLFTQTFGFTIVASEKFQDFELNGKTPWSHVGPNESIVALERRLCAANSMNQSVPRATFEPLIQSDIIVI